MTTGYTFYPCGDHAITLALGDRIDAGINERVIAFFYYLSSQQVEGIKDIIPAYHTLTVVYDLEKLVKKSGTASVYQKMHEWLQAAWLRHTGDSAVMRQMQIPVCYHPSLGPDLESVAKSCSMDIDEIIDVHTSIPYRVYLIGFLPGFAYMGTIDARIATPRKATPRTLVPAGSVGIAGRQTGIYPFDSPGGWQLIGQTPLQMFNVRKDQPSLLQPGDEVQFYQVTLTEFNQIRADEYPHP